MSYCSLAANPLQLFEDGIADAICSFKWRKNVFINEKHTENSGI